MKKEEQVKKKKTKKRLRWPFKILLISILIIIYSFTIGTKGIVIRDYNIKSGKITSEFYGLKILQFSDLHYGSSTDENLVKQLVKKINEEKPDVVIFTGDLISKNYSATEKDRAFLKKQLSSITSTLGNYYVTGEEDFDEATTILNDADFINLANGVQLIYNDTNNPILLIDNKNAKTYFESNETVPDFKILAIHNPDDFNNVKQYNFDIVMAGHTLNGQINIPKLKELFIASKYTDSYQKINNTKLFINPGIGTGKIKARLFNHPTIYLYRLNKVTTS